MIEVANLSKSYHGNKNAVSNVSFSAGKGEILGFLGPNGAGKSTTLNIITGYIRPSEGTVLIDGEDILSNDLNLRKKIGYLPENPPLYTDMTVNEYLNFVYELKKSSLPREEHLSDICAKTGIIDVRGRLIKNLSKGYRQRLGLAQALVNNPEILILDEPSSGLDPLQIVEMRDLIKSLRENHTIILSTHILSEVQTICDRIIIIADGYITADGNAAMMQKDGTTLEELFLQLTSNDAVEKAQQRLEESRSEDKQGVVSAEPYHGIQADTDRPESCEKKEEK